MLLLHVQTFAAQNYKMAEIVDQTALFACQNRSLKSLTLVSHWIQSLHAIFLEMLMLILNLSSKVDLEKVSDQSSKVSLLGIINMLKRLICIDIRQKD